MKIKLETIFMIFVTFIYLIGLPTLARALTWVDDFGVNPGNLKMYMHIPQDVPPEAPLVVALHGCSQSATSYDRDTEWSKLADEHKFYVLYPETNWMNNFNRCFNWFLLDDYERDSGEGKSIISMIEKMKADFSIDDGKVFVTGLSAGGAMTTNLMASYPDVFAGGAPMAGIPAKCATNLPCAFQCMAGRDKPPEEWGDLARSLFPEFPGSYPRIVIFHGASDYTVDPLNAGEIMEQWTDLHETDQIPEIDRTFRDHPVQIYRNVLSQPVVVIVKLETMSHGITVDPGGRRDQGGNTGLYSFDKDIWSTYYSALFWGILNREGQDSFLPENRPSPQE